MVKMKKKKKKKKKSDSKKGIGKRLMHAFWGKSWPLKTLCLLCPT
jgi:hypothetical protein